jgi:hypothetical protein
MLLNLKVRIELCLVNLVLEVTSKSCEDSQIAFNFHKFWSEELHCER